MYDNYSDSENEDFELLTSHEYNTLMKVRELSLQDFLSCNETKQVLQQEWNNELEPIQDTLQLMGKEYVDMAQEQNSSLLCYAENKHIDDFVALITHHISTDYDCSIFQEYPLLALPLIQQYDEIQKQRVKEKNEKLKENLDKANKSFDWNTKKYT